jgi:UDP-3-O-[3-hydroxymyristoyl] glucosamine N-acyltransferase
MYELKYLSQVITVGDIQKLCEATLLGDASREVSGLSPYSEHAAGCISFSTSKQCKKFLKSLENSPFSCVLVSHELFAEVPSDAPVTPCLLGVNDPYSAFLSLVSTFYQPLPAAKRNISTHASVDPSATIGKNVSIGDFCVIGQDVVIEDNVTLMSHTVIYKGAKIGADSLLHARVTVREFCEIGRRCILHTGTVIGSDGFGYRPTKTGLIKVPHVGIVAIADDVEVGANSCIDRATFGKTVIGSSTKVDNLVQIGHNVHIGSSTLICGQAGIAGSCIIGNGVVIGGSVGLADHVHIADGVRIGGKSGVISSITKKGDHVGFPAIPAQQWRRQNVALSFLGSSLKKVRSLFPRTHSSDG